MPFAPRVSKGSYLSEIILPVHASLQEACEVMSISKIFIPSACAVSFTARGILDFPHEYPCAAVAKYIESPPVVPLNPAFRRTIGYFSAANDRFLFQSSGRTALAAVVIVQYSVFKVALRNISVRIHPDMFSK